MNFNTILALLEIKGVISREEGEKINEHVNNRPQSTHLADAVTQVRELLGETTLQAPALGPVGPEQANEEVTAQATASAPVGQETPATEFPTLPGANESAGNDLSIAEMSDTAKETNKTGNDLTKASKKNATDKPAKK